MVVIKSFQTVDLAYLAASRLESAGIAVEIRDDAVSCAILTYTAAVGGVKLAVHEEDIESALEIFASPAEEEGIIVCPYCKSTNISVRVLSPTGALLILTNIPIPFHLQKADCNRCGKSHNLCAHPSWK